MSNETKAKLGYSYGGMWGSIEPIPAEDLDQINTSEENYCPNNYYLCIPVAEAREFLSKVISIMATHNFIPDKRGAGFFNYCQEIEKARALLATLPEEETDGAEV